MVLFTAEKRQRWRTQQPIVCTYERGKERERAFLEIKLIENLISSNQPFAGFPPILSEDLFPFTALYMYILRSTTRTTAGGERMHV